MPARSVIRRDKRNHSNLRPKHKHTKQYLQHYWPYLPLVTVLVVGLMLLKPVVFKPSPHSVLAISTNTNSQGLLTATNKDRASNSKGALRLNDQLNSAAQAKAEDMVTRNYWSHNTPDGNPPWIFISNAGYSYQKAGENLAYGFKDSSATVDGWMNSPPHRQNLLDGDFLDVGFGIASSNNYNNSGPSSVVVAMYGRSSSEAPIVSFTSTPSGSVSSTSYNTSQQGSPTSKPQTVSRIDLLTGSKYPWITPTITFVMGAAIAIFALKHSLAIKRSIKKGEKFVVTHPAVDVILVLVILGSFFFTRQVGLIL